MTGKEKLEELYSQSYSIEDIQIPSPIMEYADTLGKKISSNKGAYTVLITLGTYKSLNPLQDIRYHKIEFENGFSGRSFDTEYITPVLKGLGLPSMAESGWLTRSLEQAAPYTLDYQGKITPVSIKDAFLNIVDYIESNPGKAEDLVRVILNYAIENREANKITISPLENPNALTIDNIMMILDEHFSTKYEVAGASKLPVLAFYSIYSFLIKELKRYEGCELEQLGSHTASDRTSRSSGDIEIMRNGAVFESIEIKGDKLIDSTIVRIAQEKIYRFNPARYYVLSYSGIKDTDMEEIKHLVSGTKESHGCLIIINGIMNTIKYYLRLISSLEDFLAHYSELVSNDKELKLSHKHKINEIIENFNQTN